MLAALLAFAAPLWRRIRDEFAFVVLLVVAVAGAWLYVGWRQTRADRDDLAHRVELICTAAGQDFAAGAAPRGQLCRQRVASLVAFRQHSDEITAQELRRALAEHDARQLADNLAARTAAEAAQSAAQRMEAADAEAERKNLVDREWFAAVNDVAGLRAPARLARQ